MAKITRKTQKIFGGNSSSNAQFGSARVGTFVLDNDPDVIQALPAWESGLNAATISGEKLPALEEEQGIQYVVTRQISYIFQEGIPEYDSNTEYVQNSLVKEPNTVSIYKSLVNDNEGNALNNGSFWRFVCNFDTVQPLNNYTATIAPTVNDDSSLGYSAGSYWYDTVSDDIYFCVDATVGAAVWVIQSSIDPSDLGTAAFVNTGTSSGQLPLLDSSGLLPSSVTKAPTRQFFQTSGSYSAPAGCKKILVRYQGAGGGGGARDTNNGSDGGNTTFNSVVANGGEGGRYGGSGTVTRGGNGGNSGTGTATRRFRGSGGFVSLGTTSPGGNSALGFIAGNPVTAASNPQEGVLGSGGSGAGSNLTGTYSGGGGGAGEYVELEINNPTGSYTYTIGVGGAGGPAGTVAGAKGGDGWIEVTEFY